MAARPDPRAELKAFAALALDMARVDPDRRPSTEVRRWLVGVAAALDLPTRQAQSNRELFMETLRLTREVQARDLARARAVQVPEDTQVAVAA